MAAHRSGRKAKLLSAGGAVVFVWAINAALAPVGAELPAQARHGIRDNTPRLTAVVGATVHVAPGNTIQDAVLVLADGRVVAVGARGKVTVPAGAEVLALPGRHVYAGFVDPYSDYGLATKKDEPEGSADGARGRRRDNPPQYTGTLSGARSWNDAIHAERRFVEEVVPSREAAAVYLESGVTVVQTARLDGIFRGRAALVSLAEGTAAEVVLGEGRQFGSFDKGSSTQAYPSSLMGSIALVRQTLLDATWSRAAQAAYARNPRQPMPEVDASAAALAADDGPIVFATGDELSLLRAARALRETGRQAIHLGSDREALRLAEIAALDQPVILPATLPRRPDLARPGSAREVSLASLRQWEQAPCNAAALVAGGVEIAFTRHGLAKGEDLLDNVRRRIGCGLSADQALAALTTVPAELTGLAGELGTLEPGRRANLVIADRELFVSPPAEPARLVGGAAAAGEQGAGASGGAATGAAESTGEAVGREGRRRRGGAVGPRVLATWIDGRVVWEAPRDWRGKYALALAHAPEISATRAIEVEVSGEVEAPKAKLVAGEITVEVLATAAGERSLAITLAPGAAQLVGLDGLERLSLFDLAPSGSPRVRELVGELGARAHFASGRISTVNATRTPAPPPVAKTAPAAPPAASALVSRRTFPNVGFGFTTVPSAEALVIRDATVWTSGPAGRLTAADVHIAAGKVVAVGVDLVVPAGTREIDGRGRHVTPGLIDEHSHLAISQGVNEGSHAVTAEVRIADVLDPDDIGIYRALAGGATAAQLLHGSANPIGGQAAIIKHRWGVSPEALNEAGAAPTIKFALGENVKQSNWGERVNIRYPQTRMGVDTLMRDRFHAAREHAASRRAYEGLSAKERERTVPPRRDLQLETLAEILESKRFVHIHSYVQSEILAFIRLAEELGFTIQTFTHILEGYKVAPEMAKHGAGASAFADWWAYKFEVFDAIPYAPCLMHDAGVLTSINSDSGEAIRRLNQEAAKAVTYCGMDEIDALNMVTINPARQLRLGDRIGSLEVGKDADLVMWTDHPLSVTSRVDATWVDGVRYFDRDRDAELRQADAAERTALLAKIRADSGSGVPGVGSEPKMPTATDWDCEDVEDVWHVD